MNIRIYPDESYQAVDEDELDRIEAALLQALGDVDLTAMCESDFFPPMDAEEAIAWLCNPLH